MNEAASKKDLKQVEDRLDARMDKLDASIDALTEIIKSFMQQVDERFNGVEERLDRLEESHERLLRTIDSFIGRMEEYDVANYSRDSRYDKLFAWAKKVSKKTGIPLDI
jgi:septal ring factor EnvC (AmiA/AmiB activator)